MRKSVYHNVLLWVFFFFCCSTKTFAQPTADFTVNATHGCNSLNAFFSDISTGNPTTWFWDFGNGQTSILQNPTVVYSAPGSYTVTLTVTNNSGNDNLIKTNYIVVDSLPAAHFSLFPGKGCTPFPVSFIDLSDPGAGNLASWSWDFGDGGVSSVKNPLHIYTTDGIYSVKLSVKNSKGCADTLLLVDTVSTGSKPIPDFSTKDTNVCASHVVNFTNKTKGNYTSFFWYFGDTDTSSKFGPNHYYDEIGYMDVKLIAYNYGCVDSVEFKKYVYIKPPIVRVRYTFNCDSPYVRNFQSRLVGVTSYVWDYGDGYTSTTDKFPSHTYAATGKYNVSIYGVSDTCDYLDTVIINIVDEKPTYSFVSKSNTCKYDTVKFKADNYNPANIDAFAWDYGDGTISVFSKSGISNYEYTTAGTYYPSLIVRNILGCYDTIRNNVPITIYGPVASFSVDSFVCTKYGVIFTDLSTGDGNNPVFTWIWDYGDGTIDSLKSGPFIHSYKAAGIFNVKLKVIDAFGCTDTLVRLNGITAIPKPDAAMVIIDTVTCFLSPVSFFDQSQSQALGRRWFLGDGDTSTQSYLQHIYSQPGIYDVKIIIGDQQGCSDTATGSVRVMPLPALDAGRDTFLCYGQALTLKPSGAVNYTWLANPSLSCFNCPFPLAKPFSSTYYYLNGASSEGCIAIDSIYVEVKPVINLVFQKDLDTVCYGKSVQLLATGSEIYNWKPSAGLSNPNISNPIASPVTTTSYQLIGTDSRNCFTDTAYLTVVVIPNPTFNIIDTSVIIAAGSLYTIKTTGSPDIVKWQWLPPTDLDCPTCPEPQAKGDKIIEYTGIASNTFGCTAIDKIKITALCNNQLIFIPNTFSPNGDNRNDRFFPRGKGLYLVKSMRIYNRLGQVVFQKFNFAADTESDGWDGTYYGRKLPSDVYIYNIEIMCNNGIIIKLKGNITLLL